MPNRNFSHPPVFTIRLGAMSGKRVEKEVLIKWIRDAGEEAFSLTECEGYFRGERDPGWAIMIAHNDPERVAQLAETLRRAFQQEGVGMEAFGRYLRCREDHGPAELAAEMWGLQHGFHPAYYQTLFVVEAWTDEWPTNFLIVTAYATTGETWSAGRNDQADQALAARIESLGVWKRRITGTSPDGQHAEPGWALDVPLDAGRRLGREFLQDAVYFVRENMLHVASCLDDREAPVGVFMNRLTVNEQG